MRILKTLAAVALAVSVASSGWAANIPQRGGAAFLARIGPWHVSEATYSDGATVCWANNWENERRPYPIFSFVTARGSDHDYSIMRYNGTGPAKPGQTVKLVIGDKAFTLFRPPKWDGPIYVPRTAGDVRAITDALEARSRAAQQRSFYVVDPRGRRHRFDNNRTTEMITFLENRCGFERY